MYEKKAHVILNVLPKHLQNNESESFALSLSLFFIQHILGIKTIVAFVESLG